MMTTMLNHGYAQPPAVSMDIHRLQGRGAAVGDDLTLAAVVSSLEIPSPWSSSV